LKICRDEVTDRDYIWYARNEITFQREHLIISVGGEGGRILMQNGKLNLSGERKLWYEEVSDIC